MRESHKGIRRRGFGPTAPSFADKVFLSTRTDGNGTMRTHSAACICTHTCTCVQAMVQLARMLAPSYID